MRRRPDRAVLRLAVTAAVGAGGLALALGLGLPDPGVAERAFAGLLGLLGCVLALRWFRAIAEGRAPRDRFRVATERATAAQPLAPSVESTLRLGRALGFGVSTIGSYNLFVRPRLQALAEAKLARAGCGPNDAEAARKLIGDDWELVDPKAPPAPDRMAPGVSLLRVARIVATLERLP